MNLFPYILTHRPLICLLRNTEGKQESKYSEICTFFKSTITDKYVLFLNCTYFAS